MNVTHLLAFYDVARAGNVSAGAPRVGQKLSPHRR
jgi:hypothetical protein